MNLIVVLGIFAAVSAAWWWLHRPTTVGVRTPAAGLAAPCRGLTFEGSDYIICTVAPDSYDIVLRRLDGNGKPYEKPDRLRQDTPFVFAMNAGMYHEDFSPVGLYVEDGRETTSLNLGAAPGNFFMKPNGVFFVDQTGRAGVLETQAYATAKRTVRYATQSGPMLVIEGKIHPRFEPDGQSKHIRNGVGVDKTGAAIFAISRMPVSLGAFARLFRDELGCANALFFDGAVSALHDGQKYLVGGGFPAGPIVAVIERRH